ncbi:MAG: hypothetical protein AAF960_02510 [Bacteroidota bacterium]
MMSKQIVVGLLASFLAFSELSAQQLSIEDMLLEPSALLQDELGNGSNAAYQKIEGNNNTISLEQLQQRGQQLNLVRTLQVGNDNEAFLEQLGAGNQLVLIQNGTANVYSIVQEGINNQTVAIQNGNDNLITQELMNANGVYSEFIQNGNGNEIIHITNGFVDQRFIIRQNGNGLKATVIQSN